jgi:subtilisin family serine protease
VIAVGATDSSNTHAAFSNYGGEIDLVAPGVNIYSTSSGSSYMYRDGTSMSTAYASGLAAILLGIPGNNAPSLVRSIMESTALDLGFSGWDGFYGNGLIQMDSAILTALSNSPGESPALPTPFVFLPGGILPSATFTSNPTTTVTALPVTAPSETITLTPEAVQSGNEAEPSTPEIIALGTQTSANQKNIRDWLIPCSATLLILLALFLFIFARRQKRNPRSRRS